MKIFQFQNLFEKKIMSKKLSYDSIIKIEVKKKARLETYSPLKKDAP
jgi:hypothetical protein